MELPVKENLDVTADKWERGDSAGALDVVALRPIGDDQRDIGSVKRTITEVNRALARPAVPTGGNGSAWS